MQFWLARVLATGILVSPVHASEVAAIFNSAMKSPNAVHSYEFSSIERDGAVDGDAAGIQIVVYQSGGMYRAEAYHGKAGSSELPDTIFAFNGERYQNFERSLSTLSFSAKNRFPNPYGDVNPMLLPYMWILPKPSGSWEDLRFAETWAARASEAKLLASKHVQGFECDVVELPYTLAGSGALVTAHLARDLGHYPLRVEGSMVSVGSYFTIDVVDHLVISTELAPVVVPIAIRLTEQAADTRRVMEWAVVEESVKINHVIPEELFTISPGIAKTVDDFDRNTARILLEGKVRPPLKPLEVANDDSKRIEWVWLVNIVVVAVLAVLVIYQRRKSHGRQ